MIKSIWYNNSAQLIFGKRGKAIISGKAIAPASVCLAGGRRRKMYFIAVCDDDEIELDKTEKYLSGWQEKNQDCQLHIDRFTSAEKLLYMLKEKEYDPDLLFLDIYMPEKSGMDLAREVREMGSEGKIVFLTTSKEHALEAFSVDAAQYLIKPIKEQDLFRVLDRMFADREEKRKDYLLLRIEGKICRVLLSDIVYCEAQGKNQKLYLEDNAPQKLRMSMTEIYGMLAGRQEFAKVGVSYIVNLNHVDSLNAQEICLDTGKSIYLPRGAYQPLREQYFKYYCEEEEMG